MDWDLAGGTNRDTTPFNVLQHILPQSPLALIQEQSHISRFAPPSSSTPYMPMVIVGFSDIVIPLICLTHKDTPFTWGPNHTKAFKTLKTAFTQAPILARFNPDNPIVVEMDASNYAIAAIISQISPDDGDIHLTTFYSHSMQLAELNYEIYDKELLAIFKAFQQWHNYLEGSSHVILMLYHHKNLEYFATTKQLM